MLLNHLAAHAPLSPWMTLVERDWLRAEEVTTNISLGMGSGSTEGGHDWCVEDSLF